MQLMPSKRAGNSAPGFGSAQSAQNISSQALKESVNLNSRPAFTTYDDALSSLSPQGNYIFALDIGTRTVVGIIGEYIDDKYYVRDYAVVPHTKRAMVDGQVEDIKQVAKIVSLVKSQLEEKTGLKLTRVAVAAAGRALKTRHVTHEFDITDKDFLSEDDIKSMEMETIQKAQEELDSENKNQKTVFYCVGHTIVNYLLDDYKILSLEGHKGKTVMIDIIAAFLPSIVVEGLYSVMELNSLEICSLTLEPIAAMNVIIPAEIRLINIALVDIGAGTSDIAIAKDGSIVAYAMATTAGDEITEEIIKTYFVDFATAEKLKLACSENAEEVEYTDIFGIEHKENTEEFFARIKPAVEVLSRTICDTIVEVNGSAPAAVFLVGGGSLVNGLTTMISEKLKIDKNKVAVGSHSFLKNVDVGNFKLGAEFVTPVGIGVTAVLNQGYDFSVITLNDRKVRVFDTKQITVYELLTIAGYHSNDILGHSGRSLTYSINGVKKMIKGGVFTPASVFINNKPASLTSHVTQGDIVRMVPAENGVSAKATLRDVIDYSKYNYGTVTFMNEKHKFGLNVLVNGKPENPDYSIQLLDNIVTEGIFTVADLFAALDIELDVDITANGKLVDSLYLLCDGDIISYVGAEENELPKIEEQQQVLVPEADSKKASAPTAAPAAASNTVKETQASVQPVQSANVQPALSKPKPTPSPQTSAVNTNTPPVRESGKPAGKTVPANNSTASAPKTEISAANYLRTDYPPDEQWHEIVVSINGKKTQIRENTDKMPHTFLELLNYVDIDPTKPQGDIELTLNGKYANFSDVLKNGDSAVIRWKKRA